MSVFANECINVYHVSGGLFTSDQEEEALVFRFAVERINADKTILQTSHLIADVETIDEKDSFHADKKGKLITHYQTALGCITYIRVSR